MDEQRKQGGTVCDVTTNDQVKASTRQLAEREGANLSRRFRVETSVVSVTSSMTTLQHRSSRALGKAIHPDLLKDIDPNKRYRDLISQLTSIPESLLFSGQHFQSCDRVKAVCAPSDLGEIGVTAAGAPHNLCVRRPDPSRPPYVRKCQLLTSAGKRSAGMS